MQHDIQKTRKRSILAIAGLAMALSGASRALAVSEERFFLRWNDWFALGIDGGTAVVGNMDAAQANVSHVAFLNERAVQIAYPFPTSVDRIGFVTPHATATMGAIGARNPNIGTAVIGNGLQGFAPAARLLSGNFAAGFAISDGTFSGLTSESYFFALLAMTDQEFADTVRPFLRDRDNQILPAYRVASVVNVPFGSSGGSQRRGEDQFSHMADIIVTRTGATLVAPAGNLGSNSMLENLDPPEGSMVAPGAAFNVISVGFTETGLRGTIDDDSSEGPNIAYDWRRDQNVNLIDTGMIDAIDCPAVNDINAGVPNIVNGRTPVDVVAPGFELELPGNFAVDPLNNTSVLRGWTGSSFASSIVAGALALVHDAHRRMYFQENPFATEFDREAVLPQEVTRAILLASANKEQGWNNGAFPNEDNISTTAAPLDPRFGGGRLDMRQLLRTYMGTPVLQGYRDIRPGDGLVFGMIRDPSITDPADPALLSEISYVASINFEPLIFEGTNPTQAMIQVYRDPNQPMVSFRGAAPSEQSRTGVNHLPERAGGEYTSSLPPAFEQVLETPTGAGSGLDTPSSGGGSSGGLGGVSDGGASSGGSSQGSGTGGGGSGGGSGAGTSWGASDAYKSGWDHGMVGMGRLDIPIGIVTGESDITVALTWQRRMLLDERVIDALAAVVAPARNNIAEGVQYEALRDQAATLFEEPISALSGADDEETIRGLLQNPLPTMMAGAFFDPDRPDNIVGPADSDTPAAHVDPNTTTSPYRGVCHIEVRLPTSTRIGSGVIIGPNHVMTAAHLMDVTGQGQSFTRNMTITFNGVGADNQQFRIEAGDIERVHVPAEFLGFGVNPPGNVNDDLAIIEIDSSAVDFAALGLPIYGRQQSQSIFAPPPPFPTPPPIELIMVGYGPSGSGQFGVNTQIPVTNLVKRVGRNEFLEGRLAGEDGGDPDDPNNIFEVFAYDFDAPPGTGIVSNVLDGPSLGNRFVDTDPDGDGDPTTNPPIYQGLGNGGESMALDGDSGGPAFLWFDGNLDGVVQDFELRVFGINTFKMVGSSGQTSPTGRFGNVAGGTIISAYNQFIADVLSPTMTPLPPLGPEVALDSITGTFTDMVSFQHVNLDLELWRRSFDGTGNIMIANSISMWDNCELIHAIDDDQVPFADYFVRIVYALELYDFGGFRFCGFPSRMPLANRRGVVYTDNFDAEAPYGLAWYVDLTPDRDLDASLSGRSSSAANASQRFMGDMNHDTRIDGTDLSLLLSRWGSIGESGNLRGDLNHDGVVASDDLAILLGNWTGPRPR